MSRLRILFVDDEIAVLDGIQNLLHKQRHEWDMVFASSGRAALAEIAVQPFDVVVSDMRMPVMDGAQLLQRVLDEHPGTIRIVLSGYAERGAIVRSLPVAHQFLSKPCDANALIAVIGRARQVQALLSDQTLRHVAGGLDTLPASPQIYLKLTAAMAHTNVTSTELARIIETDPAMVGKMLQLVNSAYFGLARRVSSIEQAVTYLGTDVLKGLVLNIHVFHTIKKWPTSVLSLDRLQTHSLLVARLARKLVAQPQREAAFAAGIVHDVGKIVLASSMPDRFASAIKMATDEACPLYLAERQILGITHAELGAYLLGIWGLPFEIVEAVAYHHAPAMVTTGPREVLAVVHAVDALIRGADHEMDKAFLADAGVLGNLPHWREIVAGELSGIETAA